jgi:hypothetical protein
MTDYDRTTIRRTVDTPLDPSVTTPAPGTVRIVDRPVTDPAAAWTTRPADLRTTVTRERTTARPQGVVVAQRIVGLLFGILQAAILVRIILLLLVANHDNGIVSGILSVTNGFIEPFRGMFALDKVTSASGSVLDVAALVALVGWTLIEALILAVLRLGDRRVTATE